jgi:hypothetical protein
MREIIKYRFRISNAAVFTLYSFYKDLEYTFRVPATGSLSGSVWTALARAGLQIRSSSSSHEPNGCGVVSACTCSMWTALLCSCGAVLPGWAGVLLHKWQVKHWTESLRGIFRQSALLVPFPDSHDRSGGGSARKLIF